MVHGKTQGPGYILEIHICWKVDREARIEPPIQTEYFRSAVPTRAAIRLWSDNLMFATVEKRKGVDLRGATILTFIEEGAREVISLFILSAMPEYIVVPPDMTMLEYRSFLISISHRMMELKVAS